MVTFIVELDAPGDGLRVAVKDLIDVAGVPTTAGSRAVAEDAAPAGADAGCLAGIRSRARIVGKTNLHELALGITGINPWFGTPVNPIDPRLVPGGSSSGSAVAVATDEADVGIGSDTGGSIRLPAACCGVAGLKTTYGRIPVDGARALAPSLDTIGPLARDVSGLVAGMQLLEPGFAIAPAAPTSVGRLRLPGGNPVVDTAIDDALRRAELATFDLAVPGWDEAERATADLLVAEAWAVNGHLVRARRDRIGNDVVERHERGARIGPDRVAATRAVQAAWRRELDDLFARVEALALPVMGDTPPTLEDADRVFGIRRTIAFNLVGLPALALPVPCGAGPASVQLVAPAGGEEELLALGLRIEAAVGT